MSLDAIVFVLCIIVFSVGAVVYAGSFKDKKSEMVRFKRQRFTDLRETLERSVFRVVEANDNLLPNTQLVLPRYLYLTVRYIVIVFLLVLSVMVAIRAGVIPTRHLLFIGIIFLLTTPSHMIFGIQSPFAYALFAMQTENKTKMNKEIFRVIGQMKNLSFSVKASSVSSTYIIESLARFTKHTRSIFEKTLSLWYVSRFQEAHDYFCAAVNTDEGRALAALFLKLDHINSSELRDQLETLLSAIREKRKTIAFAKKENQSKLLLVLSFLTVSVMLVNFMVVVVFIDSMSMLQNI